MPLYSFDCPKCQTRVQKALVPGAKRWMDCPNCGTMMKRQDYTRESTHLDDRKKQEEYYKNKIDEAEWKKKHGRM